MGKIWRPVKAPPEAVGVKKDTQGVAVGKMRRPRRPVKAVGVKDAKGVAVIAVDDGEVEASVLGAPVVATARGGDNGPLEDGAAVCRIDSLDGAPVITTTPQEQEAVGVKRVVVRKMWRSRRPAKAPLKAVGVKDAEGISLIAVDGEVEASMLGAAVVVAARGGENGPLEDGSAVCRIDSLNGAPVITTTRQEAVGVKGTKGVAVGKMWQPRRSAKVPLKAVGVKDGQGVAVISIDGKVEASLPGAPIITTTRQEAVGVKGAKGVAVGKMWQPRRSAKAPLEAVGVKDAQGVAVGKMWQPRRSAKAPLEAVGVKDAQGVAVGKMWQPRRPAKAPLEAVGVKDAQGVAVITIDGKVEASLLGAPVVTAAGGYEKGPLEEGIVVCQMDALDEAPVTTQHEAVGVKDTNGVAVGKMWRPRQPAKAPLEALGAKDAERVAVITVDGKVEASVLGVSVVEAAGGGERAPLEATGVKDAEGVAVITVDGVVKPLVLGVPVVAASGGGDMGPLEDGTIVCLMDSLDRASVIATDEKEEASMQGDPVFPAVDQKVDAPVVEGMQATTMKGNGKEDKDKDGIKWPKHYSTTQSILTVGDGDFSFSLALATTFGSGGNLVATSLDSYEALTIKYGKAESNVRELKRLGATVLHGVDAKKMKLHSYLEMRRFDRIVFNFPHAGFNGREKWLRVIKAHKQLVHGFLANARQLLRPYGEIHLSHKTGLPYDAWDIEQLAYESCLIMVRKVDFSKEDYPGYNQKKGDGVTCDESFPLGPCCTFMFCVGDVEKLKQAHGNRVGSISSCLGDSKFYPGISAADMMWPFDLHPAWPQPHFPPVHLPIAFDPCPFGVAEMEHPFNCYGTSFHHQDMVQPTHQEQPWYEQGPPPIEAQPWTPQQHQSLQREYEIHRQLTLSLEDRYYMESVERHAMLEMLIQVYGR